MILFIAIATNSTETHDCNFSLFFHWHLRTIYVTGIVVEGIEQNISTLRRTERKHERELTKQD